MDINGGEELVTKDGANKGKNKVTEPVEKPERVVVWVRIQAGLS